MRTMRTMRTRSRVRGRGDERVLGDEDEDEE